jgi:tetratricopeptide (TPR) repeat protein
VEIAPEDLDKARALLKAAEVSTDLIASRGNREEALTLFRRHGDELGMGEALVGLSWEAWISGHSAEASAILDEATELLERHPPGRELSLAYRRLAGRDMILGRAEAAVVSAEKALELAERLGLQEHSTSILQFRGIARCELGEVESGLEDLRAGLRLALERGYTSAAGTGYSNLGSFAWLLDGPAAGLEVHSTGIEFAERRGIPGLIAWLKAETTWMLFDLGRWDEVLKATQDVVEWDRSVGGALQGLTARAYQAQVLVRRGETAEAAALAADFVARGRDAQDAQLLVPALAIAALVERARGDLPAAMALIEELEQQTSEMSDWHRARFLPELTEICVAARDNDPARRLADGIRVTVGRAGHSLVAARAVLAEADGRTAEAVALYDDAAGGWREYGFGFGLARSLLGAGRCLLALGRADEAKPRLNEARDIFAGLEAAPALAEVDALLGGQPATARAAK